MNKTRIEWTDYTWNPIVGCRNNCWYCYAQKLQKRFYGNTDVMYFHDRLAEPRKLKKPNKIFVCSMSDLFGDWVDGKFIEYILNVVRECPQHTFQFLTKNPKRYAEFSFPQNCWLGVTITGIKDNWKTAFLSLHGGVKFVSFEPLLDFPTNGWRYIDWIIVGAMTGLRSKALQPKVEWIKGIERQACLLNIPVFMKNNLKRVWRGKLRQEFPQLCRRVLPSD